MPNEYFKQVFDLNPDAMIFDWSSAFVYPQRAFVKKTKELNISKDKLYITVHQSDQEAADIWHEQEGVPRDRIFFLGDKDNFWEILPVERLALEESDLLTDESENETGKMSKSSSSGWEDIPGSGLGSENHSHLEETDVQKEKEKDDDIEADWDDWE